MIIALLNQNLKDHHILVATAVYMSFSQKLICIFWRSKETYLSDKTTQFICDIGGRLKESSLQKVGMVVCIQILDNGTMALPEGSEPSSVGNHWVGVVTDTAVSVI